MLADDDAGVGAAHRVGRWWRPREDAVFKNGFSRRRQRIARGDSLTSATRNDLVLVNFLPRMTVRYSA
jgi:hypothetical protein